MRDKFDINSTVLCRHIEKNSRYIGKSKIFAVVASFVGKLDRAYRSRDGGSKIRSFPNVFFFSGMNSRGDRIAYSVSVAKTRRIHGGGESFPISRRKIGSFTSLMARRVISLFASLKNSFTESSNWGESRIPFHNAYRIIEGADPARRRALAFKPVLRRELLIRFSKPDFARPYIKFASLRNTRRTMLLHAAV